MSACEDAFCETLRLDVQPPFWVLFLSIAFDASQLARHFGPIEAQRDSSQKGWFAKMYICSVPFDFITNAVIDLILVVKVLVAASERALPNGSFISGLVLILAISPNVSKAINMMALGSLYMQGNAWRRETFLEEVPELQEELEKRGQEWAMLYFAQKYVIAICAALGFVWCVPAFFAYFYVFFLLNWIILGVVKKLGCCWLPHSYEAVDYEALRAEEGRGTENQNSRAGADEDGAPEANASSPPDANKGSSAASASSAATPAGDAQASPASDNSAAGREMRDRADQTPLLSPGNGRPAAEGGPGSGEGEAEARAQEGGSSSSTRRRPPPGGPGRPRGPEVVEDVSDLLDDEDAAFALSMGAPRGSWDNFFFACMETIALLMFAPIAARLYHGAGYWPALSLTLWEERSITRWLGAILGLGRHQDFFTWLLAVRWIC